MALRYFFCMTQTASKPDKQPAGVRSRTGARKPLEIFLGLLALIVASLPAYFQIFYRFSWWDDEGFLLATVKAVLQGHVLFDQIYTLYGPFYYLVEWIFYAATGLPPSHDCVRAMAFILWVSSALLLAYAAYRVTASVLATAFTLIAAVEILIFFQWEPGHPEEICMLLLACCLALLCTTSDRVSPGKMAALGFLVAALAQTKINLGLYVGLALALALLGTRAPRRFKRVLLTAGAIVSLALVTIIAAPLFHLAWARNYFWLVVLSGLAVTLPVFFMDDRIAVDARAWWVLLGTFAASWAAIIAPFLLRGTTISAFLYITIFQHRHFAQHWFKPTPVNTLTVAWSAFSVIVCLAWLGSIRRQPKVRPFSLALNLLKAALGLFTAFQLLAHRIDWPLGYQIMMVLAPFTWLILVAAPHEANEKSFARIALAFISIFVTLYSFPVAGSQSLFSIVPLIIVSAVFLRDAAAALSQAKWPLLSAHLRELAWAAGALVIVASYARDLRHAYRLYRDGVSLALPGATHIHVFEADAATYHWLVQTLDTRCPSFFSMPGLFSLYFWTRRDPPTLLMMNDWPAFFGPAQQRSIVNDLVRHSTSCIVYNPALVAFLSAGENSAIAPLAQYIFSDFVTREQRKGYYFMVRSDKANAR